MNKIYELANKELLNKASIHENSLGISEDARKVVDMLFTAFEEHVKYFRANHPDGYDSAKREWTKTFIERGISMERVQKGIKALRKERRIYNSITPSEFLELCEIKAEDIGAPSTEKAYIEACRNAHPCETNKKWSHEAVRLAAHETGSFSLRTESKTKTFPIFEKNYLKATQDFIDGKIMSRIGFEDDAQERETQRKQGVMSDGYERFNKPQESLSFLKSILR
jgi:hypothetical protein